MRVFIDYNSFSYRFGLTSSREMFESGAETVERCSWLDIDRVIFVVHAPCKKTVMLRVAIYFVVRMAGQVMESSRDAPMRVA